MFFREKKILFLINQNVIHSIFFVNLNEKKNEEQNFLKKEKKKKKKKKIKKI